MNPRPNGSLLRLCFRCERDTSTAAATQGDMFGAVPDLTWKVCVVPSAECELRAHVSETALRKLNKTHNFPQLE
jgi:hypothetical protein